MTRKRNDAFLAGPRPVRPRAWQVLATGGAIAMATAPVLAQGFYLPTTAPAAEGGWLWQAQAEGGEGGEAGDTASGDATVDFLAGLLQIEGHLASGFALWQSNEKENGLAHMGHPKAEVYEAIKGMLTDFGPPQFEAQLEQLVEAAANGAPDEALNAMYANILAQIGVAREAAVAADPKDDFTAIVHLIRKAGDEWAEGVKDGTLVELHEYQDAWGFVQAARDRAMVLSTSADPAIKAAAEATLAALGELSSALPAVLPTGPVDGDAGYFAAAAAKIELAAFKVK